MKHILKTMTIALGLLVSGLTYAEIRTVVAEGNTTACSSQETARYLARTEAKNSALEECRALGKGWSYEGLKFAGYEKCTPCGASGEFNCTVKQAIYNCVNMQKEIEEKAAKVPTEKTVMAEQAGREKTAEMVQARKDRKAAETGKHKSGSNSADRLKEERAALEAQQKREAAEAAEAARLKEEWAAAEAQQEREAAENEARQKREVAEAARLKAAQEEEKLHGPMIAIPGKGYEMGKYEVTQGQWKAVMGSNPPELSFSSCGDTCPVESVSWNDVQEFIGKLNTRTGKQYRLPTEAEWEYACYGGSQTEYCGGNDINVVAWHDGNSGKTTHPVGQKQANGYGLYDMSGNVWEQTSDCWEGNCAKRVVRGGSWGSTPRNGRAAFRFRFGVADRYYHYGFRLVRTLP